MPLVSVSYSVTQRIARPARDVHAWATHFTGEDMTISGRQGGRKVVPVCNDTIILEDTTPGPGGQGVQRDKLVRLYPRTLTWTNTHLTGPNRHSQLLYQLTDEGPGSCSIRIQGLLVLDHPTGAPAELEALARSQQHDVEVIWKTLAGAAEAAIPAAG